MMTAKKKAFCEAYLANGYNALAAYRTAFPESAGNKNPSYPYTLLKDPEVIEYVETRRKQIYDAMRIDSIRVIQEIAEVAFAEKGDDTYNVTAKLKALDLLSKNLGLQTQKIETKEVIEVSLEE